MLAGVRNVAWGAAMVMAGFLAVTAANCVLLIAFLRSNALFLLDASTMFYDPWLEMPTYAPADARTLISLVVVIWLIGHAVRRASKSIVAGRW